MKQRLGSSLEEWDMISNKTKFNEDWEEKTLEELGEFGRGKSKHRPRDDKRLFGGKYPFIQTGDIKAANLWVNSYEKTYSEFGLAQSKLWDKNTLCITIAANIAETAILSFKSCFPDSVVGFQSNSNSNVYFMHYLFCYIKNRIQNATSGSVQDNINLEFLKKLKFNIPKIEEQNRITNILLCLDEKIELNNQMNKTLEEMAQALFKRWFIDFEFPNEEGEPYKSSGGEMVESELKVIPKGWEIREIGEISEIQNGFAFKAPEYVNDGIKVLRTLNINDYGYFENNNVVFLPNDYHNEKYSKYQFKEFDCALVMVGAGIGKIGIVLANTAGALQNQNMWRFRTRDADNVPQIFLNYMVQEAQRISQNWGNGSAREFYRKDSFSKIKVIMPSYEYLQKFNRLVLPLFNCISRNAVENERLIDTRDSLLPKLMSGEIRVSNLQN